MNNSLFERRRKEREIESNKKLLARVAEELQVMQLRFSALQGKVFPAAKNRLCNHMQTIEEQVKTRAMLRRQIEPLLKVLRSFESVFDNLQAEADSKIGYSLTTLQKKVAEFELQAKATETLHEELRKNLDRVGMWSKGLGSQGDGKGRSRRKAFTKNRGHY
jgi:chromosome segregation ATPase